MECKDDLLQKRKKMLQKFNQFSHPKYYDSVCFDCFRDGVRIFTLGMAITDI